MYYSAKKLQSISTGLFIILVAYIPLHTFLSTWVGTSFHILEPLKGLKDIVLILCLMFEFFLASSSTKKKLKKISIFRWISLYILITLILSLVFKNTVLAELLAIDYNLRLMVAFTYAFLIAKRHGVTTKTLIKVSLWVAVFVAIFGLLQVFLFSDSTLAHFGYSRANGTPAVFYVDESTKAVERAYGTLKDPNAFGAYMVISIFLLWAYKFKFNIKNNWLFWSINAIFLIALFFSSSRSAWVGLVAGLGALFIAKKPRIINTKAILFGLGILVITVLTVFRFLPTARELFLHSSSSSQSSNSLRAEIYKSTLRDIANNPIGGGPGSAGPVSIKNKARPPKISENYYLQIIQEVGFAGLALFIIVNMNILRELIRRSNSWIAIGLFCSGIALAVAGIFTHVWASDTLAILWWGLAGFIIGREDANID